jgi:phage shock protein PspC (stress-responsive transcriptional regulator)
MKETVKINLNQRLFDLDADAYSKLKKYLDTLRRYFDKKPNEAEEILQDIEQRIAEILEEKLKGDKQVVNLKDIEEIIQMMGTPADFARDNDISEDEEQEDEGTKHEGAGEDYNRDHRRLYRDFDTNIIGGVCAGIASYFNIDPIWVRLAFVVLAFLNGIGILLYIILWVAVPAARNTTQRLQMKGRPVTVENIQESVKSEYDKVKDNLNRYSQSESFRRSRDTINEVFTTLGRIILAVIKVILIVVGVCIAIAVVACILGLIGVFTTGGNFNAYHFHNFNFPDHFGPLFHDLTLFSIALAAVILIPVIAILAGIIKLVFNIKTRHGILSAFAWTIWSLALVYVIIAVLSGNNFMVETYKQKDEVTLNVNSTKPMYIKMIETSISKRGTGYFTLFGKEMVRDKIENVCYIKPQVYFNTSEDSKGRMLLERSSSIPPFDEFDDDFEHHFSRYYDYEWKLEDTLLLLDQFFSIDDDHMWQLPGMRITIYLPEGQNVMIDRSMQELVGHNQKDEEFSILEYNVPLIMEKGRLRELNP